MKARIEKFDANKEYFFEEGCFINELSNSENDKDVSIAQARVAPGEITKWHSLSATVERYVILKGQAVVEIGDSLSSEVTAGDVVIIPPNEKQRIKNTGDVDLLFLAICSPRFIQDSYQSSE